ncbi:glycerophosphodiester phosphodiesterase [Vagococcus sp. BWB3-3]|uniref:Glycerophosphodiester phosphodiesterase n=1 Tax=Vagococcus allomyrinae TaxID=2794353 RepID=A0A940SVX8_9ENTE|nr:glycerophosphodiester phosphodiesterase [Vagococcus allomyrinae]MBP1040798.1 glycerophosphodiester phosphodiesterase [Vagococcus allomyrinae]
MKQVIQESLGSVWTNRKVYIKSLLLLTVIQGILFLPVLGILFNQILHVAGLQSITETTLLSVLMNPLAVILLILLALLAIITIVFEMGFFFLLAHFLSQKQQITFKQILIGLSGKLGSFISFQLILFLIYFVLLLPLASIGLQSMVTESLRLPYFIADELFKSTTGTIIYLVALLGVFYISMRLIFTLPIFILERETSMLEGMKKSWLISKGQSLKNILVLASILVLYHLLLGGAGLILVIPIFLIEKVSLTLAPWVAGIMLTIIQAMFVMSFGLLQAMMAETIIRLGDLNEGTRLGISEAHIDLLPKRLTLLTKIGLTVVMIVAALGNIMTMREGIYAPATVIIAHRGETSQAIENTLTALIAAADIKADYVELDVMETKDKGLVVFHDDTLRRLANRNDAIKDLTLAEINEVVLSNGGLTDRIPTLAEFIDVAKEHQINLLIEIKLHGNESTEMVQNVVKLMNEKGVANKYLVQSLDGNVVSEVKQLEPAIKTGYLVALNIGNLPSIPADFLVLEDFSVNQRLLDQAKAQNKTVFVWTVNRENLMRQYLRMNIDGMITNQPKRAIELRQSFEEDRGFGQRVRELMD